MRYTTFLCSLILISTISYSQYRNDFMIADSGRKPAIDFDENGNIHLTWINGKFNDYSCMFVVLDSTVNPNIPIQKVSKSNSIDDPKLAIRKSKSAIVWEDRVDPHSTTFSTYIKGRMFEKGNTFSNILTIDNSDSVAMDAYRRTPEIIWLNDTSLIVLWSGQINANVNFGIYAQRITNWKKTGNPFLINDNQIQFPKNGLPKILYRRSLNDYLVFWSSNLGSTHQSFGRIFDSTFIPTGSAFPLFTQKGDSRFGIPSAVCKSDGQSIFCWSEGTYDKTEVFIQSFGVDGSPIDAPTRINEKPAYAHTDPSIAIDEEGKIVVIWTEGYYLSSQIVGQRFFKNGEKLGINFYLTKSTMSKYHPQIKLQNDKMYAVWDGQISGNDGIHLTVQDFYLPTMIVERKSFASVVSNFELYQNYPNPFNPTTTISYALPKAGNVALRVYDILGKKVATLVNDYKQTGRYTVKFDASKLSSGMYIYKLVSEKYSAVKKMILVK